MVVIKKLFYLLIVISLLIPVISCQNSSSSPPPVVTDSENTFPFYFKLELSRIPQPGQTAELTFYASLNYSGLLDDDQPKEGLANGKAWLDFYWINLEGSYSDAKHGVLVPLSEVIVNGTTTLQGNVRETGIRKSTIQLPREGIWKIVGNVQGEGWAEPETITKMYVIADGYGFNYGFTPNPELADSPLTYLMYFPYGQLGYYTFSGTSDPVIQELDVSKVPLTGERATVTVKITSLHDVTGFSSEIEFWTKRGQERVGIDNLYSAGHYSWFGDLKANEPVQYSLDLKFPDEGEWYIVVRGTTNEIPGIFGDYIELTVNNTNSFYGWKPLPPPEDTGPDPNQAAIDNETGENVFPYKTETTQPEITQSETTEPEEPAPFNWLPIIIAIPAVVILGGVLAFLLIRRKRR